MGQRERSYRDEVVQDRAGVNQDRNKAPSFESVTGGKGKSEYDGYETRNEKAQTQGAVRPLNHSTRDEEDGIQRNKPPTSYNGTNFGPNKW
ncbi:hypothetical protein CTI12_AA446160 [Artemisia annua]|uniref:Uncharacterized protein n=1 Tax=Artemisia annua TaxID=35608 RepID=A0A2U1LVP7_ARTAN|nr:hypothetical protein CTI12_AA446160 [Artemisia annua]